MSTVSFSDVSKAYPGRSPVLTSLSFDIRENEFFVLVGPSGSGKSTLLRMIAGLEAIESGEIMINGRVINPLQPGDRNVSMVFQNYALFPHMSVFDNIAFGLRIRRTPRARIRELVHATAKTLGLTSYLDRKPHQLSGGQCQRVALGRAMIRQPDVFLFDEPLSNLDASLRAELRVELSRLHRQLNTTMIYVTHDQTEAMTLADRICVLHQGIIQQIDPPNRIYNEPANIFVASFFGSPPMNLVTGVLHHDTERDDWSLRVGKNTDIALNADALYDRRFADYVGRNIYVGFRPRAVTAGTGSKNDTIISGKVKVSELLGEDKALHVDWAGNEVVACVPAEYAAVVDSGFQCAVPADSLHFFDAEGCRI